MAPTVADRYTIISADTHGGGNMAAYREHLDADWRDEFDAWRGDYKNPFRDLQGDGRAARPRTLPHPVLVEIPGHLHG